MRGSRDSSRLLRSWLRGSINRLYDDEYVFIQWFCISEALGYLGGLVGCWVGTTSLILVKIELM